MCFVLMTICFVLGLVGLLPYKLYWDYHGEAPFSEEVITSFKCYIIACVILGLIAIYFGEGGLAKSFFWMACYLTYLVYG